MKPLIVANWKCNPITLREAEKLFDSIRKGIKNVKNSEVVICPPFVWLSNLLASKPYTLNPKLGAQDCFWEGKGAFTGEISPAMLKNLGVDYVIIGHSERRKYQKETDEMINKKLKALLGAGLKPILCVGSKDRNQKKEFKEIKIQLKNALSGIKKPNPKNIIITYEPVWAISTTEGRKIATSKKVKEGASFIRNILIKLFDKNFAHKIKIIYGGSVDSKNVREFLKEAQMAGVLVGAASLNPQEFIKAVKNASSP